MPHNTHRITHIQLFIFNVWKLNAHNWSDNNDNNDNSNNDNNNKSNHDASNSNDNDNDHNGKINTIGLWHEAIGIIVFSSWVG